MCFETSQHPIADVQLFGRVSNHTRSRKTIYITVNSYEFAGYRRTVENKCSEN